ncbi:phosphomannomutase [Marinospirillum perlucidum]|uniref:phosphomannomutase n=1 Tax=Marinospirillum perlucidum TaxID=1982602 RepID=UPI000DF1C2DF|nr:phosphomannomutase [Marinospirillum perlucidum]
MTLNPIETECFKAYDIRGQVPEQLNNEITYRLGRALVCELTASTVVVGQDMRLESPELAKALIRGIIEAGADVIDLGLCGTEEVYFATSHLNASAGIMITASHNPKGYNGMKLVREESRPISNDTGLLDIRKRVENGSCGSPAQKCGSVVISSDKKTYIEHLLNYVNVEELKPLKIVADPGNGMAGPVIEAIKPHLPIEWVVINGQPDGHFPNGVPNPLLPSNRSVTAKAVIENKADMGLAWDGDFDRCFFFDENGRFIEGYYLVGLLAESLLAENAGEKIIHDPRLTWNTLDQVQKAGGQPIQSKTGHAFIKERMRRENAIYGGEMSAHHYFRDFAYCDSGMIPWLLVAKLISQTGKSLSQLVDLRMEAYPCSGEINFTVDDAKTVLERVESYFHDEAPVIDRTDGLSMEFENWRMNLRASNTEPLLRLNVETRGDTELLDRLVDEVSLLIQH